VLANVSGKKDFIFAASGGEMARNSEGIFHRFVLTELKLPFQPIDVRYEPDKWLSDYERSLTLRSDWFSIHWQRAPPFAPLELLSRDAFLLRPDMEPSITMDGGVVGRRQVAIGIPTGGDVGTRALKDS
jgi:hypothetical protein